MLLFLLYHIVRLRSRQSEINEAMICQSKCIGPNVKRETAEDLLHFFLENDTITA